LLCRYGPDVVAPIAVFGHAVGCRVSPALGSRHSMPAPKLWPSRLVLSMSAPPVESSRLSRRFPDFLKCTPVLWRLIRERVQALGSQSPGEQRLSAFA
jgi:hypothetical protein